MGIPCDEIRLNFSLDRHMDVSPRTGHTLAGDVSTGMTFPPPDTLIHQGPGS